MWLQPSDVIAVQQSPGEVAAALLILVMCIVVFLYFCKCIDYSGKSERHVRICMKPKPKGIKRPKAPPRPPKKKGGCPSVVAIGRVDVSLRKENDVVNVQS